MQFKIASVDAFIINFSKEISLETSHKVKFYFEEVKQLKGIVDLVPSYTTLLITFDIFETSFDDLKAAILKIVYENSSAILNNKRIIVPVFYDLEVGYDLERIANYHNISIKEVISYHTSLEYNVFAIGFAPGFAYLGEVSENIAMARLSSPRKLVPKGSVAIADKQTAIYPEDSPGGWNIIGRTPFKMFDKKLESLSPVSMGDTIIFKSVGKQEFLDLGGVI